MSRTVLQVPLSKELKISAEAQALAQGFSSLQDAVRMFLNKLINGKIEVTFQEPAVRLSKKNEARYIKMIADIKKGKNVTKTNNLDELFSFLK